MAKELVMKNKLFKKCVLVVATIYSVGANASAPYDNLKFVTCTHIGMNVFEPNAISTFEVYNGFSDNEYILVNGKRYSSKTTLHTWITYKTTYQIEGSIVILIYPNFISTSVGTLKIDEQYSKTNIACHLEKFSIMKGNM